MVSRDGAENPLRPDEAFACGVVSRALHAEVKALDVEGAPRRTPDAEIRFEDGRRGLLEITWLATSQSFHLDARLRTLEYKLPNPGRWAWTATVGAVPQLDRFVRVYEHLIYALERHDVDRVDDLPEDVINSDPDLEWLFDSEVDLVRHRTLPSNEHLRPVWVHGPGSSAVWDADADVVTPAVQATLGIEPTLGHIAKLLAREADERHLFFLVDLSGLTPEAVYELIDAKKAPHSSLVVPSGISDIWLCPRYGRVTTHWSRESGWRTIRSG